MQNKYVAYVSTYTMGTLTNDQKSYGIKIYDVDLKNGRFTEKDQVEITNSSYVTISHNKKYLYSITDMGVESYRIKKLQLFTSVFHAPVIFSKCANKHFSISANSTANTIIVINVISVCAVLRPRLST